MNLIYEPPAAPPVPPRDEALDLTAPIRGWMAVSRESQKEWETVSVPRRLKLVRELRGLIARHAMDLASASASARSRPVVESISAEVMPLAEACRFLEREASRALSPRRLGRRGRPLWLSGVRSEVRREPFGVVLVIGPGNYPLLLPGVQVIQAVTAGNAVLLKPGRGGAAAAQSLVGLIIRAGFAPGLVTLLPESDSAAIAAIAARPDKVLFTGSAATGATILGRLAPELIPAAMELSGCDAVVIRHDADLDLAARAIRFGVALNDGATCLSPKRVFVPSALAAGLEARLALLPPREGPPAPRRPCSDPFVRRLRPWLDEALTAGARFIRGGLFPDGSLRTPVILAGVPASAGLLRQDVFGPVTAVIPVANDDEAVRLANDGPFALGVSIFSRDENAARAMAARIRAGVVSINDLIVPTADARLPFGGRGRSGYGVTRGLEGLLELTTAKVVTVSRGSFRPALEEPGAGDAPLFQSYLKFVHGLGFATKWSGLISLAGALWGRRRNSQKGNHENNP